MSDINRRKARPGADKPGFFTGMKPNFVSKTLALPINLVGSINAKFKNKKEREKPENLGNTLDDGRVYQRTQIPIDTHISTDKGMVPTNHLLTPKPDYHYFDLLNGGNKTRHTVELESTYDLTNVIPHEKWKHDARIAAKAANDEKIANAGALDPASYPYIKTPSLPEPPHLRPESMSTQQPYDPYKRK